jgi:hypothetical protein
MPPEGFHMTYSFSVCSACGEEGENLVVGMGDNGDLIAECDACGAEYAALPESAID